MRRVMSGGLLVGMLTLVSACADAPGSPSAAATTVAAQPTCHDVFHPAEVTYVGNNTFVTKPAWTEHVCG